MSFIPGASVGPYRIVEQAERDGLATTYTAYRPAQGRYVVVTELVEADRCRRGWPLSEVTRVLRLIAAALDDV